MENMTLGITLALVLCSLLLEPSHSFVSPLPCRSVHTVCDISEFSTRLLSSSSSSSDDDDDDEEEAPTEPPLTILDEEGVTDDDTLLMQATNDDGSLPGGLSPDQMMGLVQNPEVIELLKSPKMQDAMAVMMTKGPEELKQALEADPELLEIVGKLNEIMGGPPPSS